VEKAFLVKHVRGDEILEETVKPVMKMSPLFPLVDSFLVRLAWAN